MNAVYAEFAAAAAAVVEAEAKAARVALAAFLAAWRTITDAEYAVIRLPYDGAPGRELLVVTDFELDCDAAVIDYRPLRVPADTKDQVEAAKVLSEALDFLPVQALFDASVAEQREDTSFGGWETYVSVATLLRENRP